MIAAASASIMAGIQFIQGDDNGGDSQVIEGGGNAMSVALFALADASISEVKVKDSGKKVPPKRTSTATADPNLAPEPR